MAKDYDGLDVINFDKIHAEEAKKEYYAKMNDKDAIMKFVNANGERARAEYLKKLAEKSRRKEKRKKRKKLIKITISAAIATSLFGYAATNISSCASQSRDEETTEHRSR